MPAASEPSVSIVVIAFNEEANAEACLRSILAQRGLASFEVVFVDDCSTDRTVQIVESLAATHPELRVLRHEQNRGRGAARRTGQDACRAGMIGFVDADVRLPQDWLERAVAGLQDNDVVSGVAVPDGDCAVIWRIFKPTPRGMAGYWELTGNNVLFRREALERVGWPAKTRLTEDNRMAKALVAAGFRVTTLGDLRVEHHESKSYAEALAFMHETGWNATEVLRDLRVVRFPDLVWAGWLAAAIVAVVLAATGGVPWPAALGAVVLATVAVDVGMMWQRFYLRPHLARWLAATAANLPLVTTYLASRSLYAPRLVLSRRDAEH